jgi:hypothetical protein
MWLRIIERVYAVATIVSLFMAWTLGGGAIEGAGKQPEDEGLDLFDVRSRRSEQREIAQGLMYAVYVHAALHHVFSEHLLIRSSKR